MLLQKSCIFWISFSFALSVHADLPLTVEDLITDKGKFKLDLSLSYGNSTQRGLATGEFTEIQTGPTSFVKVPTAVGERSSNNDSLLSTLGLRYGLTGKAELYSRFGYLLSQNRSSDTVGFSNHNDAFWTDAWLGINYQFKEDDDTPALLAFTEVAVLERHRGHSDYFRAATLGVTTYKAIDPIVFSLTAAYQHAWPRLHKKESYQPGSLFFLNPSVAFAVNDRITLTTGLQWHQRQADQLDHQAQDIQRTSTHLVLGTGYGIAAGNTLNLTLKANISGRNGADLRLNWLYTL
jgi:hypothetical protein